MASRSRQRGRSAIRFKLEVNLAVPDSLLYIR